MSKLAKSKGSGNLQLELFQTSKRLNLSESYEAIPKHVAPNDKSIEWTTEHQAKPVVKVFQWEGEAYTVEISPADFKDKKSGIYASHFPELRESRIEYALISLASKVALEVDTDLNNNKVFILKVSYYQIQKEIVEAINKRNGKNLKPNSCPYNTTSIFEALKVLKKSGLEVKDKSGKGYEFNRIKEFAYTDKKVVIELGSMMTNYISSGDWKATDSDSILASTGMYELRLRVIFNMKFRYARRGSTYDPMASKLINEIDFTESKEKRTTFQRLVKILEKMHEVERVVVEEVDKRFEGRKLIDLHLHIHASDSFIETMIENNKLTKRSQNFIVNDSDEILVDPVRSEFSSNAEYQKAKSTYEVQRGKFLLSN